MKILDRIATILILFGSLNWGLVGVADFNIIMWVFIDMHMVQHIIYIAIGLAAIWKIVKYTTKRRSLS
jgi:uncharacterized membrane protein YuzA (DUF378 family)